MALDRLYYAQANSALDDTSTALRVMQSILWGIKAMLTGVKTGTTGTNGTPPVGSQWTVTMSSSSLASGASDLWGATFDATKIIRGTAAAIRSWIVLQSPATLCGNGVPFYLKISFNGATDATCSLTFAKTAFVGGSTTVEPTSVDSCTPIVLTVNDVTAAAGKMSYVTDAKGNFHIEVCRSGVGFAHTFLGVSEYLDADTGDLFQACAFADSNSGARGACQSSSLLFSTAGFNGAHGIATRAPLNDAVNAGGSGVGIIGPTQTGWYAATGVNQLTSKLETLACKMWFVTVTTLTVAYKGKFPNWWLGNSARASGTVDPPTGASEMIQIGQIWVPNGGVAQTN